MRGAFSELGRPMTQARRDLPTRRAVLSGLAMLPATATPASEVLPISSPASDPIFAAIDAYICADNELVATVDNLAAAEQAARSAPRGRLRRMAERRLSEA